jgi:hypothetical protein
MKAEDKKDKKLKETNKKKDMWVRSPHAGKVQHK